MAKTSQRKRADLLLVDRGLAESREQAQTLIAEGLVFSRAGRVLKASSILPGTDPLEVRGTIPYVSRGGLKLAHALDTFHLTVDGFTVLDVGASTGGFTDCLLQRGAERVYALDVGHGQMAYKLRQDPRVTVMENLQDNSQMRKMEYKKYGMLNVQVFAPRISKPVLDEIDNILARHYGFTDGELDFIINYDIKYRLGVSDADES